MSIISIIKLLLLLLLLRHTLADEVAHPGLKFLDFGGQIGVLGHFDALSFYNYENASSFLLNQADSQSLYLRNTTSNSILRIATIDGGVVDQLLELAADSVLISGNFTSFNNVTYLPPIIYNVTSGNVTGIFPLTSKRDSVSGSVLTTFVDGDIIYMGGDFEFNNTYGVATYNITSKTLASLPFQGFGANSTVNAISKLASADSGSIVFGGSFNSLGLSELLVRNVTTNTTVANSSNSTNSSLISAEQLVSLKHGAFTNVNGASGNVDSSPICPGATWALVDDSGGEWAVLLPSEMGGLTPTKVRLYATDDDTNGIKLFRIYTFPNNGIMNLSYVDPSTNQLAFCDAWCPLLQPSALSEITQTNLDDQETIMEDDLVYINDDGSFAMYYDPTTKSRSLGYSANFQEFALVDNVAIDKIGLTILEWYGSRGEFAGFELYLDSILVFGNDTLNDSNCGTEAGNASNLAVIDSGSWVSVTTLSNSLTGSDYLVSVVNSTAGITLYPNISYSGDYSILFYTPGCSADGSCSRRSIVNVTVIDTALNVVANTLIYQNNLDDKFDYLFYGHLNGSSAGDGRTRVQIEFYAAIDASATEPWVVVDKVVANIVSLDNYYSLNLTNSSSTTNETSYELEYIYLNGLFEFSLANFTDFDESLVFSTVGNETVVEDTNTFVGNSTINELSGKLSSDTVVNQIVLRNSSDSSTLLLLGEFSSQNVTLLNNNLLSLTIDGYNTTLNESEVSLNSRRLAKREQVILGATFNTTITSMHSVADGFVVLGEFLLSENSTSGIKDLSKGNSSTSAAYNFALNLNSVWYSFGNSFIDADFSRFASLEIDGIEYYIFSTEDAQYEIWDNTNAKWVTDRITLDISTALSLSERDEQILGGSSFNVMDFYGDSQAYFQNNTVFSSFGLNISSGEVLTSFFVNSTFGVIGGKFAGDLSIKNVAFISNDDGVALTTDGWADDTAVKLLYVDNNAEYLIMGTNGSVEINSSNATGIVVFNLQNRTFASIQPADLSNSDGSEIQVNAMVLNDDGHKLLVGGRFDSAGSLGCESVCVYDLENTRWVNPATSDSSLSISGNITDAKFYSSNLVLLSGNMTLNSTFSNFAVYDFASGSFGNAGSALNNVGSSTDYVKKFIINDDSSGTLGSRMVAYGSGFVSGFNGSLWSSIDSEIDFSDATTFTDMKLLKLSETNSANSKKAYFDDDKVLILAGVFNLTNYGLVNSALFDGRSWIPYIFSTLNSEIGEINSLLVEDVYLFQSSSDLKQKSNQLSTGKVVGISLACALGSTALLGLLYLIPMFYLFRRSKKTEEVSQRIYEDEMMNVVNPEDLLHEIDLQRNS